MARSAPSATQAAHFSALPAVANTLLPNDLTIWIAVTPIPEEPPCTRKMSPCVRRARSKTFTQTVKKVSGSEAASTRDSPLGIGRHCGAGAVQYSAYPPPATSAQTSSPTRHWVTPTPSATMLPETSSPGISDAPGGGG